jgi:hypothetical protein
MEMTTEVIENAIQENTHSADTPSYPKGEKESLSEEASVKVIPLYDDPEALDEGSIGALESAEDIVTQVIHVDDDPTMNPWTFRMFFVGEHINPLNFDL